MNIYAGKGKVGMKMKNLSNFRQKLVEAGKVALDSNVFVYLLEKNENYFPQVEVIFQLLEQSKIECISSIMSLLEVLSPPRLLSNPEMVERYVSFFQNQEDFHLYDVDLDVVETAAEIRRNFKIHSPDAIQLATAKIKQAKIFVTNDRHFEKLSQQDESLPEVYLLS